MSQFELHPNVNVFVGVNGSGKTSVLDAVGLLIKGLSNLYYDGTPEDFSENDISIDVERGRIMIDILPEEENSISLSLSINRSEIKTNKNSSYEKKGISEENLEKIYEPIYASAYYKTIRYSESIIYSEDIDSDFYVSDFDSFTLWYVEQENHENRIKVRKQANYQNPILIPVRNALNIFFDTIESNNYSNLYVEMVRDEDPHTYNTILFIEKNKIPFRLDSLSDGEKMLILLIGDITRRLTTMYDETPPEKVLEQFAIVLIDEIDLHLHPAWQRDIIPALTHVFPNVQFLVTTHSPQVLSNVRKECVHIIEDFKRVPFTPSTFGADSNMILWDIFGVKKRPQHLQKRLSEYYRALEKKSKDEVLEILEKIEKDYGADRIDIKKARMDFQFEYDEYLPKA